MRAEPYRTESPDTFKGMSTKVLLSLCVDVGQRGMRRDKTGKLSSVNHQQLESEDSGWTFKELGSHHY